MRFGALTGQSVQVLRLLREAFGVTFRIKQETTTVAVGGKRALPGSNRAGDGKRARRDADSEDSEGEEDGEEGDDEDEEDGSGSDGEEEEGEEGSENSEGSGDDEEEGGSEGSGGSGEDDSEDDEEEEKGSAGEARKGKSSGSGDAVAAKLGAQSLERSTVLLSCYGVGYSNVYRKVT